MKPYAKSKREKLKETIHCLQYPEQLKQEIHYNCIVLDEKFLNLGGMCAIFNLDYVLVFENPDHEDFELKDKAI